MQRRMLRSWAWRCIPSTVGHVRHFICRPFATLYDQYSAKITGIRYNYEWHFNGVLQAPHPAAYRPSPTSPRRLIFTFWWSNPTIANILGYKWNTKSIFLPNVLPLYSEMALKCIYFALITHIMTWSWRISSMLKLKHAWETKSVHVNLSACFLVYSLRYV